MQPIRSYTAKSTGTVVNHTRRVYVKALGTKNNKSLVLYCGSNCAMDFVVSSAYP